MKHLFALLLALWLSQATASTPPEIQIDITMEKITSLIKAGREGEALPYFAELEAMNRPLPEAFHYYYIRSLEKAGRAKEGLQRTHAYFGRYAKKGQYYKDVVAAAGRLSIVVEKEEQARKEAYDKAMAEYTSDLTRYQERVAACPKKFDNDLYTARRDLDRARDVCNPPNPSCSCEHERRWKINSCGKARALREYDRLTDLVDTMSSTTPSEYCSGRFKEPKKPVAPG